MNEEDSTDYVDKLTAAHSKLFSYIYSLTGSVEMTKDVLQETNRKLWKLRDEYDKSRPFNPWAYKVAYNQVRAARTKLKRDKLIFHDEEVLKLLADEQVELDKRTNPMSQALEKCLEKLSDKHQKIVKKYYYEEQNLDDLGRSLNRSASSLAVTLHRIRATLSKCIMKAMS